MTTKLSLQITTLLLTLLLAFGFSLSTTFAHDDEVDDDHHSESSEDIDTDDSAKIAQMKQIIAILKQIIELHKQKAKMMGVTVAEDHHAVTESKTSGELSVWVELHSNQTHAHVQKPGMQEQSWLLEDLKYTEEEAIIDAISEKSGLSVHDIEEIIVFPSGKVDANGDSVEEHDEDADQDVSGIHIMNDGKIMWGNGTEVHGAVITIEGKIKLSDGTIVVPKFDLR